MNVQVSLLTLAIATGLAFSGSSTAANLTQGRAVQRATAQINGAAATRAFRNAADGFTARDVIVDADGTEHVRFERSYRGLPVIGGDLVTHVRNSRTLGVSQGLRSSARPGTTPRIKADDAIVEAGARFGTRFSGMPTSRLVVYALGASPVLAHEVVFKGIKADQTPTEMHYFVDASSGAILNQWDAIHTALPGRDTTAGCNGTVTAGTGKSLTLGNVTINTTKCGANSYEMRDPTRGGSYTANMAMKTAGLGSVFTDTDNVWGNNLNNNSQSAAVDAHFGVAMTWDYYLYRHGRTGIANDGKGALSRVHYGRNYNNAFWSDGCFCMTFGDGDNGATTLPLVALDVAGHEMSHGVMSRTANLAYSGESGGLNEANSDIFGTMVEYYANDAADPGDYVMGEELFPNNANMAKAIRWMFKPSLDGLSPDCYSSNIGGLNVHYSSGPANHFYYLLAEGAVVPAGFGSGTWANLTPASLVCNGNTAMTGIGRAKAEKIWYRAISVYMVSSTGYAGARTATLNAATDLYGANSAEYKAVAAAWSAVNVN